MPGDLDAQLSFSTSIGSSDDTGSDTEAQLQLKQMQFRQDLESSLALEYAKNGRLAELQTKRGAAAFDAEIESRFSAFDPGPRLTSPGSDFIDSGFSSSQIETTDLVRQGSRGSSAGGGFFGGGGRGGNGGTNSGGAFGEESNFGGEYERTAGNSSFENPLERYTGRRSYYTTAEETTEGKYRTDFSGFDPLPVDDVVEGQFEDYAIDSSAKSVKDIESPAPWWKRVAGNIRTNLFEGYGSYALAGGIEQTARSAASAYTAQNSGHYVTPEETASQNAGVLPGLLQTAGAAVGAAIPGVGPIVGAGVGGAIGGIGQGLVESYEGRAQASRQTSELLGTSLGEATSKLKEFADQLQQTGAPLKDLQSVITGFSGVGNVGGGTIGGAGAFTNSLGEYAVQDSSRISSYLNGNPALYGIASQIAGGNIGPSQMTGLAYSAADSGDFDDLRTFQRDASRARLNTNPEYQRASSAANAAADIGGDFQTYLHHGGFALARRLFDGAVGHYETQDIAEMLPSDPNAGQENRIADFFAQSRSSRIAGESGLTLSTGQLGLAQAGGASAATQSGFLPGIISQADSLSQLSTNEANQFRAELADPTISAGRRDELTQRLNSALSQSVGYQTQSVDAQRQIEALGIDEASSSFGTGLLRNRLSGRSAASLQSGIDAQADYLDGESRNGKFLSPAQRDQLESQSLTLRYGAQQDTYNQRLAGIDNSLASAQAGVAGAQAFGTPGQVFGAQGQEIDALKSKLAELREEIGKGTLTADDRLQKERQVSEVTSAIASQSASQRNDFYNSSLAIAGNTVSADTADLDRNLAIHGNSAVTPQILSDQSTYIEKAQAGYNAAPAGSQLQSEWASQLAGAKTGYNAYLQTAQTYRPSAQLEGQLSDASSAYQISRMMPYSDGTTDGSPFTRGAAYEQVLGTERDQALAASKSATDPLARLNDKQTANQLSVQIAGLEQSRVYEDFSAFPEFIAGNPGRGQMAGILPTAGLSSLFGSNYNPRLGGFGPPPPQRQMLSGPHEGTAEGAGFAATISAAGGMTYGNANGSGGLSETNALLRELITLARSSGSSTTVSRLPIAQIQHAAGNSLNAWGR